MMIDKSQQASAPERGRNVALRALGKLPKGETVPPAPTHTSALRRASEPQTVEEKRAARERGRERAEALLGRKVSS